MTNNQNNFEKNPQSKLIAPAQLATNPLKHTVEKVDAPEAFQLSRGTPRPRHSICFATADDIDGIFLSIQPFRFMMLWASQSNTRRNPWLEQLKQTQFVVIDNKPNSPASPHLRNFMSSISAFCHSAKYIPFPPEKHGGGTSQPRNACFEHADGEIVYVGDCHINIHPDMLIESDSYFKQHPDSLDLFTGPIVRDDLSIMATHCNNFWRQEALGIWGWAWRVKNTGELFTVAPSPNEPGTVITVTLDMKHSAFVVQGLQSHRLPEVGHEKFLEQNGCEQVGYKQTDMIEIPGHGLGFFFCRKEAWLGFHPAARGFGGEEMYIHEKFRQAGRHCYCVPWAPWWHRFYQRHGVPYFQVHWDKIRNNVIFHQEIGFDISPIKTKFVDEMKVMPEAEWEQLIKDPIACEWPQGAGMPAQRMTNDNTNFAQQVRLQQSHGVQQATTFDNNKQTARQVIQLNNGQLPRDLEQLYTMLKAVPRDLDKHMDAMRHISQIREVEFIADLSGRKESLIAFAAGMRGRKILSFNTEGDSVELQHLLSITQGVELVSRWPTVEEYNAFPETDCVFLDTRHTYDELRMQLDKCGLKSRRFIIMHDTDVYGKTGEDGMRGLHDAIREFMELHPEWKVVGHTNTQYGYSVLSKNPRDLPPANAQIPTPRIWPLGWGSGTNIHRVFIEVYNIKPDSTCKCKQHMEEMDDWGATQCRMRRRTILGWIEESMVSMGWLAQYENVNNKFIIDEMNKPKRLTDLPLFGRKKKAGLILKTFSSGLAFKLDPRDPIGSMVDICIDMAAEEEVQRDRLGIPKTAGPTKEAIEKARTIVMR